LQTTAQGAREEALDHVAETALEISEDRHAAFSQLGGRCARF
jgi:hypothetical protein